MIYSLSTWSEEWVLQDYLRQVVLVLWVYPSFVTMEGEKETSLLTLISDWQTDPHILSQSQCTQSQVCVCGGRYTPNVFNKSQMLGFQELHF